jgi:hypothetical protein
MIQALAPVLSQSVDGVPGTVQQAERQASSAQRAWLTITLNDLQARARCCRKALTVPGTAGRAASEQRAACGGEDCVGGSCASSSARRGRGGGSGVARREHAPEESEKRKRHQDGQ